MRDSKNKLSENFNTMARTRLEIFSKGGKKKMGIRVKNKIKIKTF